MQGEVKSYNPSTRYGFITKDGVDYRFHFRDWESILPPVEGLKVSFEPKKTEKGWRAYGIKKDRQ